MTAWCIMSICTMYSESLIFMACTQTTDNDINKNTRQNSKQKSDFLTLYLSHRIIQRQRMQNNFSSQFGIICTYGAADSARLTRGEEASLSERSDPSQNAQLPVSLSCTVAKNEVSLVGNWTIKLGRQTANRNKNFPTCPKFWFRSSPGGAFLWGIHKFVASFRARAKLAKLAGCWARDKNSESCAKIDSNNYPWVRGYVLLGHLFCII